MSKVSVIIPCYNKADYVAESINSVLQQTYKDVEIVILNDGSSDNSADIINETIKDKQNIKFINNNENHGIIYARNTAIEASTGDYILPLDADDTIEPTYIEKAVRILDDNNQIGIVYCRARFIGIKNEEWNLPEYTKSDFLNRNCIFCSALFRKTDFIKAGKYKENAELCWEDWDLWLSIIELGLIPYRIDEILFNYRQVEEDTRTQYTNGDVEHVKKVILKNHIDLYLNTPNFVKNFFNNNCWEQQYSNLQKQFEVERLNLQKQFEDERLNLQKQFDDERLNLQKQFDDERLNLQKQFDDERLNLQNENLRLTLKRNKYKKLFNYLLPLLIIETLLIIALFFFGRL